jgi:ABC-type multidrug transport system ATPase subunit
MEIVLESVSKKFGSLRALDEVSLTIGAGQIVAVVGPNGAGKTTLLRCLSAIAAPDTGRIFYDGERFNRGRVDLRARLAFLPDFPLVFPGLTVARHVAMMLGLYGVEGDGAAPIVTQHLYEFDLLPLIDTRVGQLSRGQIYKTALTALLSVDPELWMLDEPFASGMDPGGIAYFRRQARQAAARGRTVLYSTQILDVAEKFSDRVCIIHRGKLRFFDTVANLPAHDGEGSVLEEVFRKLREEDA